jgi:hypothetical protein
MLYLMTEPLVCNECKRLWQEYALAVQAHLETVHQSHVDALAEDGAALMKSEWLERASARDRQKVRKALNEHQVAHLISELEARQ